MVITRNVTIIQSQDVARTAWSNLARYSNTRDVRNKIIKRFGLPGRHHANAEKQATQIGFCLAQAREYFHAAEQSTLATRPVQLYYGCMSLALAEILWKGDGTWSLDMLRQRHGHHGLELKINKTDRDIHSELTIDNLGATLNCPSMPRGTFSAWLTFARQAPILGRCVTHFEDGSSQSGPTVIFTPEDKPMGMPSGHHCSFSDCLRSIPGFYYSLSNFGVLSNLARCTISSEARRREDKWEHTDTVIVHPGDQRCIDAVAECFKFRAFMFEKLEVRESPSGFILRMHFNKGHPKECQYIPEGVSLDEKTTFLRPSTATLSEFGYFYVALYISGMYCRYFPDIWMKHISEHSQLSLLVEKLCELAVERLPLLLLSELDQTAYINGI